MRPGPAARHRAARPAVAVRGAAVLLTGVVGGSELLAAPGRGTALLASAAVAAALVAALLPGGDLATLTLLLLVGEHLVATSGAAPGGRLAGALAAGAGLWCLHALFDLAAVVAPGAALDRSVPVRWLERQGLVLAVGLPVALAVGLAGGAAPDVGALSWLGALAAAGLVGVPVLLLQAARD